MIVDDMRQNELNATAYTYVESAGCMRVSV